MASQRSQPSRKAKAAQHVGAGNGSETAPFHSILFPDPANPGRGERIAEPGFFVDLGLDQIFAAATASKTAYNLAPFLRQPLRDADSIAYRQEVFRDLEDKAWLAAITAFAASMRTLREHFDQIEKLRYQRQKEAWRLEAIGLYCDGVMRLSHDLKEERPQSRGLAVFASYLSRYVVSQHFTGLVEGTKKLKEALASVHYTALFNSGTVEVRPYQGEADYSTEIEALFERFRQSDVNSYGFDFGDQVGMNHIEAAIFDLVVKLYPDVFRAIEAFSSQTAEFMDATIVRFDREIQFYVAWLSHISAFKTAGLDFCYPEMSATTKHVHNKEGFDLALAGKLLSDGNVPVRNDFHLMGRERIIVVSGPNQGGKTTFARTFGQLHYLAALGCPVPGRSARLFIFDELFTHFEREEDIANLRGKLEDDIFRIHAILEQATPDSIVILNEIFTSTTLSDATRLSHRIAQRLIQLDLLCVWVTFIDELASLGPKAISMMSTVVPGNPAERTYKIIRRRADGLAYAMALAEKHGLTRKRIRERLSP